MIQEDLEAIGAGCKWLAMVDNATAVGMATLRHIDAPEIEFLKLAFASSDAELVHRRGSLYVLKQGPTRLERVVESLSVTPLAIASNNLRDQLEQLTQRLWDWRHRANEQLGSFCYDIGETYETILLKCDSVVKKHALHEIIGDDNCEELNELQRLAWAAERLVEKLVESVRQAEVDEEVELVAKQLDGNGPAIFRFLVGHPKGVTFSEFKNYRDPATMDRLTESESDHSISAMLRRLSSQQLVKHDWRIETSPTKNLIKITRREKKSQV